MYASTLFTGDAHRDEIRDRLYYYLMREASDQEVDRYIAIEVRVGHLGDAAVIAAWCREQEAHVRLDTNEICAVGGALNRRVERKRKSIEIPRRPSGKVRSSVA